MSHVNYQRMLVTILEDMATDRSSRRRLRRLDNRHAHELAAYTLMVLDNDIGERRNITPAVECWSLAKWHGVKDWINPIDYWATDHRILTINRGNNEVILYYGAVLAWAHNFPEYRRKWGLGDYPTPEV